MADKILNISDEIWCLASELCDLANKQWDQAEDNSERQHHEHNKDQCYGKPWRNTVPLQPFNKDLKQIRQNNGSKEWSENTRRQCQSRSDKQQQNNQQGELRIVGDGFKPVADEIHGQSTSFV